MAKEKKKFNQLAMVSGAVGLAGALLWRKKDLAKGALRLKQKKDLHWVQIGKDAKGYLTRADEAGREALFAYLSRDDWRLADQVADGYFWINSQEQILLLQQQSVLMGKYWAWKASRSFDGQEGQQTVTAEN